MKRMKALVCCAAAACLAMVLAGCSSQQSYTPPEKSATVSSPTIGKSCLLYTSSYIIEISCQKPCPRQETAVSAGCFLQQKASKREAWRACRERCGRERGGST